MTLRERLGLPEKKLKVEQDLKKTDEAKLKVVQEPVEK
jgi:hypothetical protein